MEDCGSGLEWVSRLCGGLRGLGKLRQTLESLPASPLHFLAIGDRESQELFLVVAGKAPFKIGFFDPKKAIDTAGNRTPVARPQRDMLATELHRLTATDVHSGTYVFFSP
eukprot:4715505-Amphidinium_carterae.1